MLRGDCGQEGNEQVRDSKKMKALIQGKGSRTWFPVCLHIVPQPPESSINIVSSCSA